MTYPKLSGAEIDVLCKLYGYSSKMLDLDFNDVPSKSGRDSLIQKVTHQWRLVRQRKILICV